VVHTIQPEHKEVKEFLGIMRPKALAHYEKAINSLFEKDIEGALNEIKKGLDMFRDMT